MADANYGQEPKVSWVSLDHWHTQRKNLEGMRAVYCCLLYVRGVSCFSKTKTYQERGQKGGAPTTTVPGIYLQQYEYIHADCHLLGGRDPQPALPRGAIRSSDAAKKTCDFFTRQSMCISSVPTTSNYSEMLFSFVPRWGSVPRAPTSFFSTRSTSAFRSGSLPLRLDNTYDKLKIGDCREPSPPCLIPGTSIIQGESGYGNQGEK